MRRSICTSEPRRASTRVSSGFTLFEHSSPSFGSHRTRSDRNGAESATVRQRCAAHFKVGGSRLLCSLSLSLSALICRGLARTLDSLVRVSRRVRCGRNRSASLALDVERAVGRASEFTERLARPSTRATLYEHLFKTAGDDGRRRRTGRLVAPRSESTSTHAGPRHPFNGRARPHGL